MNSIKVYYFTLFLLVFSLNSCKKDGITVNEEKNFFQTNAPIATNPELGTAIQVFLKPGGTGGINPGGDIIRSATYRISGKKLTVNTTDTKQQFQFAIISDVELRGSKGEILKLFK